MNCVAQPVSLASFEGSMGKFAASSSDSLQVQDQQQQLKHKEKEQTTRLGTFMQQPKQQTQSDNNRTTLDGRRNSLESIESRVSSASVNEPATTPTSRLEGPHCLQRSQSRRTVLVASRFVEAPKLDDDQLIRLHKEEPLEWHSIPLTHEPHNRLGALGVSECKMLTGRNSKVNLEDNKSKQQQDESNMNRRYETTKKSSTHQLNGSHIHAKHYQQQQQQQEKDNEGNVKRSQSCSSNTQTTANKRTTQIGKRKAPFMFAGILGSILGSIFFSMGVLCIKLLPDGHGLAEKTKIVFFRGVVMMLLCSSSIVFQRSTFKIRRDELWVNVLRALLGFSGIYGSYVALKYISMGDATALIFSSPVWTCLLSHFILKEPFQMIQLLALPASLVGIVLIAHPSLLINMEHESGVSERQPLLDAVEVLEVSDLVPNAILLPPQATNGSWPVATSEQLNATTGELLANLTRSLGGDLEFAMDGQEQFDRHQRWKGIVAAIGTSFIVSFVYIVLKFRKTTPIQTTTFWLGVATVVGSLAIMSYTGFGSWPASYYEWSLLLLNGLCSWLGQILLQWALEFEDASVLSVIRSLDIAMTFALSALFLKEHILWTSILGALIIALVVISIMLNSWLTKKLCPSKLAVSEDETLASSLSLEEANNDCDKQKMAPLGKLTLKLEAPMVSNGAKKVDCEAAA